MNRFFRRLHVEWRGSYRPPGDPAPPDDGTTHAWVCDFSPAGVLRDATLTAPEIGTLPQAAEGAEGAAPDETWVRLIAVAAPAAVELVNAALKSVPLSPLEREDVFSRGHQVKISAIQPQSRTTPGVFALLPHQVLDGDEVVHNQVALVQYGATVVLLYDRPSAGISAVFDRIRSGGGRVRRMGADYLAYLFIDAIVDDQSALSGHLLEQLEDVEEQIVSGGRDQSLLRAAQSIRHVAVWSRRMNAALASELHHALQPPQTAGEASLFQPSVIPYVRDAFEHVELVVGSLETRREQAASLVPLYAAVAGAAMNEVMRTLTVIATIFIPLTFVAGIYGMNFANMPELAWRWGYPVVLAAMVILAGAMIWYFRRKRWM